jgi:transposase InsO family protein
MSASGRSSSPRYGPDRRSIPRFLAGAHALPHPRSAGGRSSEFAAEFEQACQRRQIPLFVLPPCSPKLNGHVQRAHRTHNEEFYEVTPNRWSLPQLSRQLLAWEHTYNTIRPHQALGYATPAEFLQHFSNPQPKIQKCH